MSTADLSTRPAWLAEVSIRLATQSDLPAMEWEGTYIHFRRVYARAFERFQNGEASLWVAEREPGYLLGQLFVLLNSEIDPAVADGYQRAFIHSFRVRPEIRGAGLGTRLLDTAELDLAARGFQWSYLHVAHENEAAIRLYERCGYHRLSTIDGDWSYIDHLGRERQVHEPGWRMLKVLDH